MQGEYVRQIAVCGGSLCSGHKLMRDLVIDVYMSPSVLISCAASSRTCQHVAVHRTAQYAVQEPTCF